MNIVDLGGFTVDCLQMNHFNPNAALCTSLYYGVNTLHQKINDQMRGAGGRDVSEVIIEDILKKTPPPLLNIAKNALILLTP